MIQNFFSVFQQVCILFILIAVGFLCGKLKIFNKDAIKNLSTFVLYFVTPCVIVDSFNRPFEKEMLKGLLVTFIAAIIFHFFNILLAHLCIQDKEINKEKVLRFGTVFSNCGYMAIPLQQALLGSVGVFYSAAFIGVFNVFNWSYGAIMMSKEKNNTLTKDEKKRQTLSYIRKSFLNPGVIGLTLGLALFFCPFNLPKIIASPVHSLSLLNTPVPMVIIGFYLSEIKSFAVLKKANFWLTMAARLVVSPAIFVAVLYLCRIRGTVFAVLAIASCTPSAANTVMFATLFNRDTELASELVTISTLFSIITMPLIITFAMTVM